MITAWIKHIKDEDEKQQYIRDLKNSKWILDQLMLILNEMSRELDSSELSPKAFDSPNWDYRQADLIGQRKALERIKRVITLDQKE